MLISSVAQPINQPDALHLLLDRILGGADVTLIDEGNGAGLLLDLAAECLAERRSRILRAADVLPGAPGTPMPTSHVAGPVKASVLDDGFLTQGFQALTVLDPTCARIVLLVHDAHALQHPALRYIQFLSRSGAQPQFVFCGTHKFLDLLQAEEFGCLRARLMAGLVVTLAAPIAESADIPLDLPAASSDPAALIEETAVPLTGERRSAVSASTPSRFVKPGALALLGLVGAACLVLSRQNGEADGSADTSQAAAVIQPSEHAERPAMFNSPTQVSESNAPRSDLEASAAASDIPAQHSPVMASDAPVATPGSPVVAPPAPTSAAGSGTAITVWSQGEAGVPGSKPNERPLPEPARSPSRQSAPATPVRTAAVGSRIPRPKAVRDRLAPLPTAEDHDLTPKPGTGAWESPSDGHSPRYVGSYAIDANGVRMFRLGP